MSKLAKLAILIILVTSLQAREATPVKILFTSLRDAAICLRIDPTDCNSFKSSTYDASRWLGYIYCMDEKVPTCADCYTHIDGENVVGVLAVVTEKVFEPVLCAGGPFQNHRQQGHSGTGDSNITALASEGGSFSRTNRTVVKADIMVVSGAIEGETTLSSVATMRAGIPVVLPYASGSSFLVPDSITTPEVTVEGKAILNTGILNVTGIETGVQSSRGDPILSPMLSTVQTYSSAKSFQNGTMAIPLNTRVKLCGVSYSVKGYGSVHESAYIAYAHAFSRVGGINSALELGSINPAGGVVDGPGEFLSTIDPTTGLWKCIDIRSVTSTSDDPLIGNSTPGGTAKVNPPAF